MAMELQQSVPSYLGLFMPDIFLYGRDSNMFFRIPANQVFGCVGDKILDLGHNNRD